jgi:multiple sugar transport system permease protein
MSFTSTILPARTAAGLRLGLIFVYAMPLVYIIATSLKTVAQVNGDPVGLLFVPTIDNYVDALTPDLLRATRITLAISVGTTAIVTVLGLPAAFVISRLRGSAYSIAISALIVFQLVPMSATLIPQFRLLFQVGLLGTIPGLVLVIAAGALPFGVLLMVPFCTSIPAEVLDAADVEGVGGARLLTSIVLPLTRNGVLVVGVLTFIVAWGEFIAAGVFINDPNLQPLSLTVLLKIGVNMTNYGNLTATAILASLPLLFLYLLVQKQMRVGLTAGALK